MKWRLRKVYLRLHDIKPFRGSVAWESNIGPIVVLWRHDGKEWSHNTSWRKFDKSWGKLCVWWNSAWSFWM